MPEGTWRRDTVCVCAWPAVRCSAHQAFPWGRGRGICRGLGTQALLVGDHRDRNSNRKGSKSMRAVPWPVKEVVRGKGSRTSTFLQCFFLIKIQNSKRVHVLILDTRSLLLCAFQFFTFSKQRSDSVVTGPRKDSTLEHPVPVTGAPGCGQLPARTPCPSCSPGLKP